MLFFIGYDVNSFQIKKLRKQFFLLYLHCMYVFLCLSIKFVLKSKFHYVFYTASIRCNFFFLLNKILLYYQYLYYTSSTPQNIFLAPPLIPTLP
jgi:hypothetical protein